MTTSYPSQGISTITAGDIILSIRSQIPDKAAGDDPSVDGGAFSVSTLLRWLNDAGRAICIRVPVIHDWYGFPAVQGQDVYELPPYITTVEQVWYELLPLMRLPEGDSIFTSKITARSWWFGPHSIHATPRLHIWPSPSTAGASTTLSGAHSATTTTFTLASTTGFMVYGFAKVSSATDMEIVRYAKVDGSVNQLQNILRGQGGTKAIAWSSGVTVDECNVFFKCYRLPKPLTLVTDPVEIPQGLWPILELYVLSKVREAEQDHQTSMQLRQEFNAAIEQMATSAQLKGLRQGIQIKIGPIYPNLFRGRIFIP